MVIVRINGYSRNEGSKNFKILDRKEIKNILNDLNINEIYYEMFLEAWDVVEGKLMGGTVIAEIVRRCF